MESSHGQLTQTLLQFGYLILLVMALLVEEELS